jgi:hypothetical protein
MTFLNAIMLFGLAAATIPFLIHLFHRQRVTTVDFSSVIFIRRLQVHQARALKLRQILLLAIRALIIILAVLAFARPAVQGMVGAFLGTGTHQKTAVALVVDNSYSMSAGGRDASPFAQAKASARRILDLLREGDEGVIVFAASPPRAFPKRPTTALDQLRAALDGAAVSSQSGDMKEALSLAHALLVNTDILRRDLYVFTDMQRHDWQALLDTTTGFSPDPSVELTLIPFTPPAVSNASLDALTTEERLIMNNQPQSITVTYTNRNETAMDGRNLSLYINGAKRGSQTVSAPPGKSGVARFSVTLPDPGVYEGYAELDFDDLLTDNRQYFTLSVPAFMSVTVVAEAESRYFLEQVLNPATSLQTPITVRGASADVLHREAMQEAEVLVVDSDARLSSLHLANLERFVVSGGGLLLFAGDSMDPADYNAAFLPAVFDCTVQGRMGVPGQRQSYLGLERMDYEHPIFSILRQNAKPLPDAPRFYASCRLIPGPQARVLVHFSDGSPAVVEGRHGRGRALLIASGVNTRWSDLALKSLFVPLMHRSVRYVHPAHAADTGKNPVGMPVEIAMGGAALDAPLTAVHPSGEVEAIKPGITNRGVSVLLTDTQAPGVYRIQSGGRVLRSVAVNVDTRESDLARMDEEEIRRRMPRTAFGTPDAGAFLEETRFTSQQGFEIWRFLVWLVLLLMLLEAWLTRLPGPAPEGG